MGTLKKSLLLFVILLGVTNIIYSQTENPEDEIITSINADTSEVVDDYFAENNDLNSDTNFKQPSTVWTFVKMIFFLALVCGAIYGVMWFFKKKVINSKSEDEFLRRVSSLNLAPGKSVEIITLLDNAYILGVTDGQINIIDKIEDKELIQAMNLNFDKNQNVKKPMNFADVLDIFMPNGPRDKNIFEDTERKITNLSKKNNEQE
ncbi:MAG: flagellar biosynthetic protein FliO [Treponema sp.]|nr:flagellar biosynthetic protein FliO [Treponema sp.]